MWFRLGRFCCYKKITFRILRIFERFGHILENKEAIKCGPFIHWSRVLSHGYYMFGSYLDSIHFGRFKSSTKSTGTIFLWQSSGFAYSQESSFSQTNETHWDWVSHSSRKTLGRCNWTELCSFACSVRRHCYEATMQGTVYFSKWQVETNIHFQTWAEIFIYSWYILHMVFAFYVL